MLLSCNENLTIHSMIGCYIAANATESFISLAYVLHAEIIG